jgi:hypothetical protein
VQHCAPISGRQLVQESRKNGVSPAETRFARMLAIAESAIYIVASAHHVVLFFEIMLPLD